MARGLKKEESYVFDTSALISLGVAGLVKDVLEIVDVVVSNSVIEELEEFTRYDDEYGKVSKELLKFKEKFIFGDVRIRENISFIEKTDNELYNIAKNKSLVLITDDIKFARHVGGKIDVQFSTYFIMALVMVGKLKKEEAFRILDNLRAIRGWGENIIYLTARNELEKI